MFSGLASSSSTPASVPVQVDDEHADSCICKARSTVQAARPMWQARAPYPVSRAAPRRQSLTPPPLARFISQTISITPMLTGKASMPQLRLIPCWRVLRLSVAMVRTAIVCIIAAPARITAASHRAVLLERYVNETGHFPSQIYLIKNSYKFEMKIYQISRGQLLTIWAFGLLLWFVSLVQADELQDAIWTLFLIAIVPALVFYTLGWRNAHRPQPKQIEPTSHQAAARNLSKEIRTISRPS